MGKINQYVCDYCGKVVAGIEKKAEVKKRYIQIKGSILVEDWGKETDRRTFFYASPRNVSELTFCDAGCFNDYIKMQEENHKQEKFKGLYQEYAPGYDREN